MGRLIDADKIIFREIDEIGGEYEPYLGCSKSQINSLPTVEAIPKDNVYKAIQEMMKYEHEGFINISLARLDEILKNCGVSENGNDD